MTASTPTSTPPLAVGPAPVDAPHRVWRLGADVDTDQLAPGAYMKHGIEVIAEHCLEGLRPDFAAGVRRGDVIAAGPNFGIGSSREQAASALVRLGLAAVIAPSYNGLFFRNAFNVGLLLMTCAEAESLTEGEGVAIDGRGGRVLRADGRVLPCEPIPGFLVEMVAAGGLLMQLQKRFPKPRDLGDGAPPAARPQPQTQPQTQPPREPPRV